MEHSYKYMLNIGGEKERTGKSPGSVVSSIQCSPLPVN